MRPSRHIVLVVCAITLGFAPTARSGFVSGDKVWVRSIAQAGRIAESQDSAAIRRELKMHLTMLFCGQTEALIDASTSLHTAIIAGEDEAQLEQKRKRVIASYLNCTARLWAIHLLLGGLDDQSGGGSLLSEIGGVARQETELARKRGIPSEFFSMGEEEKKRVIDALDPDRIALDNIRLSRSLVRSLSWAIAKGEVTLLE